MGGAFSAELLKLVHKRLEELCAEHHRRAGIEKQREHRDCGERKTKAGEGAQDGRKQDGQPDQGQVGECDGFGQQVSQAIHLSGRSAGAWPALLCD